MQTPTLSSAIILVIVLTLSNLSAQAQRPSQDKLDSLVAKAKQTHSDGLIVLQNGEVLIEAYFDQPRTPTYIASIAKALDCMAVLKLLSDGKIKSIDQPIADFYPEWRQGQKKDITLRMILSHTSGLQNLVNTRLEIETGPNGSGDDLVKLALAAEVTDKPGTVFNYNNKATCLLPGIIEQASGLRMDKYFEKEFYPILGIKNYDWKRDGTGRPQGHGGIKLLPMDLAKFGQLMLNKGKWNTHQILAERWVDSALKPSQNINPNIGLVWNLLYQRTGSFHLNIDTLKKLAKQQPNDSLLIALNSLVGINFRHDQEFMLAMSKVAGSGWESMLSELLVQAGVSTRSLFVSNQQNEKLAGFYHTGSWGNYLIVLPEQKIVAVRVVKRDKEYNEATDKFSEFIHMVMQLRHIE